MDKSLQERIDSLINTSVEDMQSGLYNYGVDDLEILRAGHKRVVGRGEKTKAKILARKIKQLEKEFLQGDIPVVCSQDMKSREEVSDEIR